MARNRFWLCLVFAGFSVACQKANNETPYHGECHCMCAAAMQPCEAISFNFCDVDGETAAYEKKINDGCAEFGVEKGYVDCALVPLGKPGEPSVLITSMPTVNFCD